MRSYDCMLMLPISYRITHVALHAFIIVLHHLILLLCTPKGVADLSNQCCLRIRVFHLMGVFVLVEVDLDDHM